MRQRHLLLGAALAAAWGCKPQPSGVSHTAYIIGPTNDIVSVDATTKTEAPPSALNAAILIATQRADRRVKFCSGTLLPPAPGKTNFRALTNHHCFATTGEDGKATPELIPEACVGTKAYFGFMTGAVATSFASGCEAGSLSTSFDGDLAVFTLTVNPPEEFRPIALWTGDDAPAGRKAAIVHFPDIEEHMQLPPGGGAKLPTAGLTVKNCEVVGAFPIEEWPLDRTLPFSLRHTCDLIHGSSGSGLVDLETGTLLGINWGGIKITSEDGVTRTDNVATQARFIQAFLGEGEVPLPDLLQGVEVERRRHADSVAAAGTSDSKLNEKGQSWGQRIKKKACGTIGDGRSDAGGAWPLLYAILLLPLAVPAGTFRNKA